MSEHTLCGRWHLAVILALILAGAILAGGGAAMAGPVVYGSDEILFLPSNWDGQESLSLAFAGGGTTNLSTNGNQGWWSATMENYRSNTVYCVGQFASYNQIGGEFANNYFTFDITGLKDVTVTSAELRVTKRDGDSDSGRSSQRYSLFDVSTPVDVLNNTDGKSLTIFSDLESGKSYGAFDISMSGDPWQILSLALNVDGLADLNAAIANDTGTFSIGGTLTPGLIPPLPVVPEPVTMVSAFLAVGALGGYIRRRLRKAPAEVA